MHDDEYQTDNLFLASFLLAHNAPLKSSFTTPHPTKKFPNTVFCFTKGPSTKELVNGYWSNLPVGIQDYVRSQHRLKSIIRQKSEETVNG